MYFFVDVCYGVGFILVKSILGKLFMIKFVVVM